MLHLKGCVNGVRGRTKRGWRRKNKISQREKAKSFAVSMQNDMRVAYQAMLAS